MKNMTIASVASAAALTILAGCSKAEQETKQETKTPEVKSAPISIESDAVKIPDPMKATDIIASINGKTMTWGELTKQVDAAIDAYTKTSGQAIPAEQLSQGKQYFRRSMVEQFINNTMLLDAAKARNIVVTDAFRAEQMKIIEEQAQKANGKTLEEQMAEYPGGKDAAKKILEDQLMIQSLFKQEVESKISVNEQEITDKVETLIAANKLVDSELADYLAQVKAGGDIAEIAKANSMVKEPTKMPVAALPPEFTVALKDMKAGDISAILDINGAKGFFKLIEHTAAEDAPAGDVAKIKIDGIRTQLTAETDKVKLAEAFAKFATENSDCPSGKSAGGSLGEFGKGQMAAEFETASFTQPIGEVGPVFKTQFGYHIVLVVARDDAAGKVTASHILIKGAEPKGEEVNLNIVLKQVQPSKTKDQITTELKNQKQQEASRTFFEKVKADSKIESKLYPELNSVQAIITEVITTPAVEIAPAVVTPVVTPAVEVTPAPAPVVDTPAPAPAPVVVTPAPAPVVVTPAPAPAPVVVTPAPAPAPVVVTPAPAPAPVVVTPTPAPVATPAVAPVEVTK